VRWKQAWAMKLGIYEFMILPMVIDLAIIRELSCRLDESNCQL
jgi:hypothetical protein